MKKVIKRNALNIVKNTIKINAGEKYPHCPVIFHQPIRPKNVTNNK